MIVSLNNLKTPKAVRRLVNLNVDRVTMKKGKKADEKMVHAAEKK